MAKNHHLPLQLLLVALCLGGLPIGRMLIPPPAAAAAAASVVQPQAPSSLSVQLLRIARAELGVQERSGRNDGTRVSMYLAYTHLGEGQEWCAAFVSWCYGQAGLSEPRSPWSPALFPASRLIWPVTKQLDTSTGTPAIKAAPPVQPGDVAGFWIAEKGRIGHAGLVEYWPSADDNWCITIEGNQQNAVRRVRRPLSSIDRIARWIPQQSPNTNTTGGNS